MKIALWHIFGRDELKSLVESNNDVLSTIREDESLEWHLSLQTVSRINNEFAPLESNYQSISSTTDEDHVLIMLVADDIDNNAISEMISVNDSNVGLANDIMDDYYGSFRFSTSSARVINSIEEELNEHSEDRDEEINNTDEAESSSVNLDGIELVNSTINFDEAIPSSANSDELIPHDTQTSEDIHESGSTTHFIQPDLAQRPVSNNHRTSTITVGEFIARLQALNLPDAKIYNQYYREGNFVEYGMPEIGICNEARTNIDNENEVFEAGHVIIF